MALDRQVVPIPFAQGIDTKSDPKQVKPGKLLVLENGVLGTTGTSLQKRPGYARIAKAASGRVLATFKDQMYAGDGSRGGSYTPSGLVDKGICESLSVSASPVVRNTNKQSVPDIAVHPFGVTVSAWEDSAGGVYYSVLDTTTGQPIVASALAHASGTKPKTLVLGQYVLVLFFNSSNSHVQHVAIPAAAPTSPRPVVDVAINANASNVWDAASIGDRVFITYLNNGASNKVSTIYVLQSLSVSAETTNATEAYSAACAITGDASNNVWIAYWNGTAVKAMAYDYGLTGLTLLPASLEVVANVRNVSIGVQGSTATVLYEVSAAATYNAMVRKASVTMTAVVTGGALLLRSVGLASKPFFVNGSTHFLVAYQSALQPTYFLATASGAIAAKLAQSTGGGLTAKAGALPQVVQLDAARWTTVFLQADRLESSGGNVYTQTGVMQGVFDFSAGQQSLEMGDNLHLSGGLLWMFDGAQVCEHGFHLYPENIAAAPSGTGGAMAAGTYQYVAVFEWTDNYGQVHRSSPSVPVSATTTGTTSSVALTVPTLRLTSKTTPISVVLYRTAAGQVVFYRITSISSPLLNTLSADTVSFTDTVADSSIIGNEQLYTTGGEVENISAPATSLLARYKTRVMLVAAENPRLVAYSKEVIQGAPVEWNDGFFLTSPYPVTALAQMDDKLILFHPDRISFLYGDGPTANGANNSFSVPQLVTTDCGCENPASVVVTPMGLMFESRKGIQLLDRSLAIQYVGFDVEGITNEASVTSAQLMPDSRTVRFTLDSGAMLVFDYYFQQWATYTNFTAAASCLFQGRFTHVRPTGEVMQETPNAFTDDGTRVRLRVVTSWLSFAGLQGFQRAYRMLVLGDYRSPHRLILRVAHDFNSEATQEVYVDPSSFIGAPIYGAPASYGSDSPYGGAHPLYQVRLHLERQKSQAVRLELEEAPDAPFGEGLALSALAIEVGLKSGAARVPATRSFG